MKTQHTPGPWRLNSGTNGAVQGIYVWKGKQHTIICTFPPRTIEESSEMEANARLIAAAPELLEVVQHFLFLQCRKYADSAWRSANERAQRVITKAEGK